MAAAVWYIDNSSTNNERNRQNQKTKRTKRMTPNGTKTQTVTKTVFDLQIFDDVKLKKEVALPVELTSIEEALAAFENNKEQLLAAINAGRAEQAVQTAKKDMTGFVVSDEISMYKEGDPYDGKFAEGDKSKQINGAVLNLAKAMNPSWETLSADQKRKAKDSVIEMLRANPAMLAGLAA